MPSPYADHAHVNSKELSEQSTQRGHDTITGFFALLRMTPKRKQTSLDPFDFEASASSLRVTHPSYCLLPTAY